MESSVMFNKIGARPRQGSQVFNLPEVRSSSFVPTIKNNGRLSVTSNLNPSVAHSSNTFMQVQKYKQKQSQIVPECFVQDLHIIKKMFSENYSKELECRERGAVVSSQPSGVQIKMQSKQIEPSTSRLFRSNARQHIDFHTVLKLNSGMSASFVADQLGTMERYKEWFVPTLQLGNP